MTTFISRQPATFTEVLNELTDLNVFFRDLRGKSTRFTDLGQTRLSFPANIYADDEKMHIEIAIVGADPADISVKKVEGDVLRIKYEKKNHEEEDDKRYYFSKTISKKDIDLQLKIDGKYDIDKIDPKYDRGLLIINIPIAEGAEPKEFVVK
jgi:HSP20 family molecular chaperone IbpA